MGAVMENLSRHNGELWLHRKLGIMDEKVRSVTECALKEVLSTSICSGHM